MSHTDPQNQGIQKSTHVSFLLKHKIILKRISKLLITHWVILARWFLEPPLPYLVSGQDEFYLLNISSAHVFFFILFVTTCDSRRVKELLSHRLEFGYSRDSWDNRKTEDMKKPQMVMKPFSHTSFPPVLTSFVWDSFIYIFQWKEARLKEIKCYAQDE